MRTLLLALLALYVSVAHAQSPQAVAAYIDRYKAIAIEEMKTYGIPASVTLAQGIHESGSGCSALAINSNNHFGIKCHSEWSGQTYHHDDDQPQECFRVYSSPEESFRDHSEFLKSRPRYAGLFDLNPTDYRAWARGLKAAGYATNPRYPEIIIKLIEDYHLDQYDRPSGQTVSNGTSKESSEVQLIKQSLLQSAATAKTEPTPSAQPNKPTEVTQYTLDERSVNGTKAVVLKWNLPLAAIAQKYNITVEQLYAFNDMPTNGKFSNYDLVYVESKKPESNYYQYEVSKGETMRDIAQKFAVRLPDLLERNGITPGCEPMAGEMIVLRGKREYPLRYRFTNKKYPDDTTAETTLIPDTKVHKVETSETLYSIAKQYNIPVDTLKRINGLKDEDIKIGQTLIVDL
jgi:LysM repeat protein